MLQILVHSWSLSTKCSYVVSIADALNNNKQNKKMNVFILLCNTYVYKCKFDD